VSPISPAVPINPPAWDNELALVRFRPNADVSRRLEYDSGEGAMTDSMKVVYELAEWLSSNEDHIAEVQALSLNPSKPLMGLKATHGLYGSPEWWWSIKEGRIPTLRREGTITKLIFAGQDARRGSEVNSFEFLLEDGSVALESIYAEKKSDRQLFRVGAKVSAVYALDELKRRMPNGNVDKLDILLEMSVSV